MSPNGTKQHLQISILISFSWEYCIIILCNKSEPKLLIVPRHIPDISLGYHLRTNLVMWRNNMYKLWCFVTFYSVLSQNQFFCDVRCFVAKSVLLRFMQFCVEKNWGKNCARGEKYKYQLCQDSTTLTAIVWYSTTTAVAAWSYSH